MEPWNKGRIVGQSPALSPEQVDLIRLMFGQRKDKQAIRDLALFNTALDSQLRGCDLVRLKVRDISDGLHVGERASVRQRKTGEAVVFSLSAKTQRSLSVWIGQADKIANDYLFTAIIGDPHRPISVEQFRLLVKKWVKAAGLDPQRYTPHSLRRTQAAYIYSQTGNLRAAQLLLGHKNINTTVQYLGVDRSAREGRRAAQAWPLGASNRISVSLGITGDQMRCASNSL